MYKKRDTPVEITIQVDGNSFSYTSNYRAFIIDIGQCCIDATKCEGCGVPIKTHIQATSRSRKNWDKCDDKNNDFHMLLISIAGQVNKIETNPDISCDSVFAERHVIF